MAGNVPVTEASTIVTPSLVVPAAKLLMAGCANVRKGKLNVAKCKVTAEFASKLPAEAFSK